MNKRFLGAIFASLLTAGAFAQEKWQIGDPSKSDYEYLNAYGNLKDYIDYNKYPNFKIAGAIGAPEYNQKGEVYKRTNANFTETVTGNAMKMASCVYSDGSMNFNTVKTFVNNASAAGLNIYGHVLAWHSQQPVTWLGSLLKDHPAEQLSDGDLTVGQLLAQKDFTTDQTVGTHTDYNTYNYSITFDSADGMKVSTTKRATYNTDVEYYAMDNIPTEAEGNVRMVITIKGSVAGKILAILGNKTNGIKNRVSVTTDWQDIEFTCKNTIANSSLIFQSGTYVGDLYIKKVVVNSLVMAKTITENRRCIEIETGDKVNYEDDNQFWILTGKFSAGTKYEFSADVRADNAATISTQLDRDPGATASTNAIGDVEFTNQWKTVKCSGSFGHSGASIAFNLSSHSAANRYFFDNVSLKINGTEVVVNGDLEGTSVESFKQKTNRGDIVDVTIPETITYLYVPAPTPLTAQEVHDTLVWAMDKWISGIMTACNGKVKAWDVVNEAISGGGNDGSGNYILQHRDGYVAGENTWDVGGDGFWWQDYMGDLEYVRQAVRLARKYGPEDIKLFINDYNLESDWDGNKKLKSLINWIKKWEADGTTHIDGIGTQMHISYYENASTQASKKKAITNMFTLMAASGKLCRVSEMDMGYCDKNGNSVATANVTEAGHKAMADFYKWIVEQYLSIIPAEQQWSICQWCSTDSPVGSGWRANTPVGWWDLNGYRKHAYAGICEGLGGVNYATGIDDIEVNTPSFENQIVYDLQGRKVQNPSHGIYIINGKKIVKR